MTDHTADARPCSHCDAGTERVLRGDHLVHVSETSMGEESKDCGRCDECNPVDTRRLTGEQLDEIEAGARYELDNNTAGCNSGYPVDWRELLAILAELRATRTLRADIFDRFRDDPACPLCRGPRRPPLPARPPDTYSAIFECLDGCLWVRIERR